MTVAGADYTEFGRILRINVVGTAGSGKSTFAKELGKLLRLPCFEMDSLFWKSDWEGAPDSEFLPKIREVTEGARWILDGNYTRATEIKWRNVQLVVWLDLSLPRTVLRVARRAIERSVTRSELWPGTGNRETLAKAFLSRDSIILWSLTSFRRNRKKYRRAMRSPENSHIAFVRLTSPSEVSGFLDEMAHGCDR